MLDAIIIGAGPAGVSCALYLQRANKKIVVLHKGDSALLYAQEIENFYGGKKSGEELYNQGLQQLTDLQVPLIKEEVLALEQTSQGFTVRTARQTFEAKHVVLATGSKREKPHLKNLQKFEGQGVSYCAVCDGFFYKHKDVAVLGASAFAIEEAQYLQRFAKNVVILTNGGPLEGTFENVIEKPIVALQGADVLESVQFTDNSTLPVQGLFVALGSLNASDIARQMGCQMEGEKIVTNANGQTNIPHVYACGDCTLGVSQIAKAVYEGMLVAMHIIKGETI